MFDAELNSLSDEINLIEGHFGKRKSLSENRREIRNFQ